MELDEDELGVPYQLSFANAKLRAKLAERELDENQTMQRLRRFRSLFSARYERCGRKSDITSRY